MKKFIVATFYLIFTAATAAGLFLSSIFISSYLLRHYVFPQIPADARIEPFFYIVMFGLIQAIPAGVLFGFTFGLWILARPGYKAFWLSLCAAMLLMLYSGFSLWDAGVMPGKFSWWTKVSEVVVFVSVFVLSAMGANRLAVNVNTRVRKIVGAVILLVFFGAFYA